MSQCSGLYSFPTSPLSRPLTLAMIEKTAGLLTTTTNKLRLCPTTESTLDLCMADLGNQEQIRRLTASEAGFHGAHHWSTNPCSACVRHRRHPVLLLVPQPLSQSESNVRHLAACTKWMVIATTPQPSVCMAGTAAQSPKAAHVASLLVCHLQLMTR